MGGGVHLIAYIRLDASVAPDDQGRHHLPDRQRPTPVLPIDARYGVQWLDLHAQEDGNWRVATYTDGNSAAPFEMTWQADGKVLIGLNASGLRTARCCDIWPSPVLSLACRSQIWNLRSLRQLHRRWHQTTAPSSLTMVRMPVRVTTPAPKLPPTGLLRSRKNVSFGSGTLSPMISTAITAWFSLG